MFGSDLSFGGGSPGGGDPARDVNAMLARVQALIDTPRPKEGYSLAWQVEAMFLGDLTALGAATVRARSRPGPPVSDR